MAAADRSPPAPLLDGAALFLDFDGTLVELADAPDAIRVSPSLRPLLQRLNTVLEGRLAIVTGRAIDDLDRHLGWSGSAVAGSHGLEFRFADGTEVPVIVPEGLQQAIAGAHRLAEETPGLLVEEKPAGVAIHFRRVPDREPVVDRFMAQLAEATGLALQRGKMVVELRAAGADKGDAVRRLMARPPFSGSQPIFVGDDLTDEHAFRAAADLGGGGILVGPERETAARWRLDDVGAVSKWLTEAVQQR